MISLDKEQTCLLELIKASLFDLTPVFPENVDWDKVFDMANVQCIVPLIAHCVPSEQRKAWLEVSCQAKAHFIQVVYEQNILVNSLNNNNIPFVILKGTAASVYYPNPSLRTYGDIDFFVSKDYIESARKLLDLKGYQFVENDDRHYEYVKNGIQFELHSKFSTAHYKDIEHIILDGLEKSVIYKVSNCSFAGLPKYQNGLVLLGHLMQHLKESGIGFRQIVDWVMFVNKELDNHAWTDHFQALAVEAGLEKLAVTVTFMCKKWLGLSNEISWCNTADEEVADQLLIRLLDDGNFGHDRSSSESIKKYLNKEGSFKYLQRAGIINWPLAQKYAVFRPFAWLHQLCRYAVKVITGLFTGKKVFMKNKHNMSLEELWERLE